ncbi:ATP-binding protein [Bacteriovorax sp. Seq25_V]|uniref:ATP-binding protein n=1 Tax=Bacteriovorax sp. Seq25_V TaxID=1201288 RepID=UPI00038A3A35|nr:ATP-binding protein [Bacteriovorax sp. Seq25_V]EQC47888.1 GHKL domain protein [Bacteriovorax sp. Seq25_V]
MNNFIDGNSPVEGENKIIFLSGLFSIVISVIVMIGWHFKINVLIQLNPDFVPMQFNTALGFFMSGLGFATYVFDLKKMRRILAILLFVLSSVTLLQYIVNMSFGIDQLFMNHYLTTLTSHPGRMAPNTALCFMGISLLLLSGSFLRGDKLIVARWIFSLVVLSLSTVALVGYVSGNEYAFGWQKYTRMAIHTSFTFAVLSFSMVLNLVFSKETTKQKWLPLIVSLSCVFCFTLFGQGLKKTEARKFLRTVDSHAELMISKITLELGQDIFAFKRLSQRIIYDRRLNESFWRKDTTEYISDFGFYSDFIFFDPNDNIVWQYREVLGEVLDRENFLENLKIAKKDRNVVIFEPAIQTEEKFFYFLFPLYSSGVYRGASLGVVSTERLFARIANSLNRKDFTFEVFNKTGDSIYKSSPHQSKIKSVKELSLSQVRKEVIEVDIYPSSDYLNIMDNKTPEIIIVSGIILSIFLGVLTYLFQMTTKSRSISLLRLNENLIFNEILSLSNRNDIGLLEKLQSCLASITKVRWLKEIDKVGIYLKADREVGNFVLRNLNESILKTSSFQSFEIDHAIFFEENENGAFSKYYLPIRSKTLYLGTLICYLESGHSENQSEFRYLNTCADIIAALIAAHFHEEDLQIAINESKNAEKAKAAFLANMSHEIRTPLNGIMGMTSLLRESITDTDGLEKLEIIESSSRTLMSIINDILDLSKIDAGKLDIENINFDFHKLINEQSQLYTSITSKKGVSIEHKIAESVPRWIISDSLRIRQIVNNFISNAVKFTERGKISLTVEEYQGRIKISVKDSGIGISELDIEKLFKDFSQVDTSTTRRFGGTGLGLSICRKLATLIGGEITVESIVGEGSIFSLIFPYTMGEEEVTLPVIDTNLTRMADLLPLKILVVDDNIINQKVAGGMLKKIGYQTEFAHHGKEALLLLNKEKFDVILMDCHMPVMDGFKATEEIIRLYGKDRPYIIALSASSMKEDIDHCMEVGMDDFLSKPLQIKPLYDSLMKLKTLSEKGE